MLAEQQLMQLENEARIKMANDDSRVGEGSDSNVEDTTSRRMTSAVHNSSGSGGYRYAGIEQAMDASASGKTLDCAWLQPHADFCTT